MQMRKTLVDKCEQVINQSGQQVKTERVFKDLMQFHLHSKNITNHLGSGSL